VSESVSPFVNKFPYLSRGLTSSVQPVLDMWLTSFERLHHIDSVSFRSGCEYGFLSILQAKVSELEQKVAEQQRAMTVLLQDKANLESRVNIFVRVLQMRDEQIEQIRSGQRVCTQSIICCSVRSALRLFIIAHFFFVLADSGYKRQRRGS